MAAHARLASLVLPPGWWVRTSTSLARGLVGNGPNHSCTCPYQGSLPNDRPLNGVLFAAFSCHTSHQPPATSSQPLRSSRAGPAGPFWAACCSYLSEACFQSSNACLILGPSYFVQLLLCVCVCVWRREGARGLKHTICHHRLSSQKLWEVWLPVRVECQACRATVHYRF